ncbi:hypothetical protein RUM43_001909 [Polyplax serrata]|uniref:Methyltransferase-like protein 9 n=1 Tax=Polyplax serrata TaxID=468196 RepID=A0AAN8SFI4_POLSC
MILILKIDLERKLDLIKSSFLARRGEFESRKRGQKTGQQKKMKKKKRRRRTEEANNYPYVLLMQHLCHPNFFIDFLLLKRTLLRRGSMFVFSRLQFEQLVSWPDVSSKWRGSKRKLLDLGAGDGVVTSIISPLFHEVFVTEVSPTMKWLLAGKGFRILDVEEWARQSVKFNVITCLNLLDRCDRPCDILEDMKKVLSPDGFVVLAMVLPYRPYVEIGSNGHSPSQLLDIEGCSFEKQVSTVIGKVLEPAGYEILRWTRLPYLCEGDIRQSYYWLDDVVFFMKPRVSS